MSATGIDSFGARLRRYRVQRGLSLEHIAIHTAVGAQTVDGWERDRHAPPSTRLPLIADALGVTVAELRGDH